MKKSTNSGSTYAAVTGSDLMFRFFQGSGGNFAVNLSTDYVKRYQ